MIRRYRYVILYGLIGGRKALRSSYSRTLRGKVSIYDT